MWKAWAYVFPVTISFGEAFRKGKIYAKMIFVKQKKPTKVVYSVKCILRYFITKYIQKHIQD